MNRVRFTIEGECGTIYSWIETDEHWDPAVFESRFGENTDYSFEDCQDPTSPIYGILEALGQSDDAPPFMFREEIVGARTEYLGAQ